MENKELIKKLKKEQAKLDKKLLKLVIFLMDQEDSQTVSDLQLNLLNVQRDAYCMFELTNAGISDDYQHRIMQKVADEYGCKFSDDELLSNEPTALLQAMLAVYAWIKLKEME